MIYLGADKHGFKTLKIVENYLTLKNIKFTSLGVTSDGQDMKLEDLIPKVTKKILESQDNKGVLICGTGIGVAVGANKIKGIRANLATDKIIAEWSVVYDNCNVLCLTGWKPNKKVIEEILCSFLNAKYDGSEKRLQMMKAFDTWR
ncbi:MAG: Ribose-5-phosphate isomerase B [Candidatus Roizmanbacteria bacterium GW2011_GWA2_35_8]|uniref:Ribose-5-phosphate isomerase B n=1 Tax=Candidatus Roizmanbacteria bacterium GW2011_GWA2_35_8 TaxID=1618479 RepID=A0A0G0G396_9BACT|nr:MAG: Ribose-5-phosphate isomerase B [Candidatus Roizmanbacteria bacterium GW2011_GWA2_35_8]